MKVEEAKERLIDLQAENEQMLLEYEAGMFDVKLNEELVEEFEKECEAIETVIAELHAMQNLLDEKNEEIEHLQKEKVSKEKLVEAIDFAINATDSDDNYSIGLCNGMIYVKSLITDGNPDYKKCKNNEEEKTYELGLVIGTKREREYWKDKIKEKIEEVKSRKCGDVFDLQAFMYEQEVIIEELEDLLKEE